MTSSTKLTYPHGILLVLLAGIFWSTMGLGIRHITEANTWQILLYRSIALSLFLLAVISLRSHGKPWQQIQKSGAAGVIGGIGLVVAFSGGVFSIQQTTVANALFLFSAVPFLTAILSWLILKEQVRRSTWVAIAIAIAGITVMVAGSLSSGKMMGNIAALISSLGFAVFTIALRWGRLGDMMPSVFLAGIFTAITSLIICWLFDYSLVLTMNDTAIAVALGVFQVGVGLVIYTIGSKVVPAAELALLSMTEIILGPLWVWLFLGETFELYTLIGGTIVMLAITYNALHGIRRKPLPIV